MLGQHSECFDGGLILALCVDCCRMATKRQAVDNFLKHRKVGGHARLGGILLVLLVVFA